jgi:hypothetical protein
MRFRICNIVHALLELPSNIIDYIFVQKIITVTYHTGIANRVFYFIFYNIIIIYLFFFDKMPVKNTVTTLKWRQTYIF